MKIEELDLVKYISWQTGFKMKDAFFAVLSPAVEKAIGKVPDISQLKKPDIDYVDYDKKIETVGQRHQVEQSGKEGFELLAFTLAVSQARSNNIDDVNKRVFFSSGNYSLAKTSFREIPRGYCN